VRPSAAEQRRAAEEMERVGREMARLAGQIAGHGLEREVREKLHREIEVQRRAALRQARETTRSLLGGELGATVERRDRVIGRLQPQVRARAVLDDVLAAARRDQGEIPFAIDAEGRLHAASDADAERLRGLPLGQQGAAPPATLANWVVVTKEDAASGLRFGIARPVRASLREIRRTAVLNFVYGVALAALCFLGIFPLSARITRNLEALTAGAEKLAQGDLETRVPIRSRDEFGRLAHTFNRMAEQLGLHRRQLVEEARRREEQEVERALLAAESQRKSDELERARAFQLSLLPREVPRHPGFALEVRTATAAEVGGDYYDFLPGGDGELTLAIGDATGHGAASGTMVAVVKGLFHARAGEASPAAFLSHANEVVRRLQLGRMAMAMTVVRLRGSRLRLAAAGMPPALVYRAASGEVEELVLHAPPLGALGEGAYGEVETDLGPGDAALLMTDGFPESLDETGEPLGYPRAQELFAASAAKPPAELLADLERAVDAWRGTRPLADDVTFVALRRSV
jgi:sigma-B regulation protein RsbU (phosphoserine phosphatase)